MARIQELQNIQLEKPPEDQLLYESLPADAFHSTVHGSIASHPESDSTVSEIPVQISGEEPDKEEDLIYCSICNIAARNKAALMRHYRAEHPLDPEKLIALRAEGKTVEEMARILEITPHTILYHLSKLPSGISD